MKCKRCSETTYARRCHKCGAYHAAKPVPRTFDFSQSDHPHRAFRRVARSGRLLTEVVQ